MDTIAEVQEYTHKFTHKYTDTQMHLQKYAEIKTYMQKYTPTELNTRVRVCVCVCMQFTRTLIWSKLLRWLSNDVEEQWALLGVALLF